MANETLITKATLVCWTRKKAFFFVFVRSRIGFIWNIQSRLPKAMEDFNIIEQTEREREKSAWSPTGRELSAGAS